MSPQSLAAIALTALAVSTESPASPVANAASTQFVVRDCRSAAAIAAGQTTPDRCIGDSVFPAPFGKVVEQGSSARTASLTSAITATSSLGIAGGNITRAYVDGSSAPGLFTLSQGTFSGTPYARVSSFSDVVQSYYFSGAGPTRRTINTHFDFTADNLRTFNDFQNSAVAASAVQAIVWVFSLPVSTFDCPEGCGGMYAQAASSSAGYKLDTSWEEDFTDSSHGAAFDVDMEAGRYYFLESYVFTFAKFGAAVDATHTFKSELGITDASGVFTRSLLGLTPAATATVPEPGGASLVVGALLALLFAGRHRPAGRNARFPLPEPFGRVTVMTAATQRLVVRD